MKVAGRRIVLLVALIGSALVLNVPAWSDEKGHEEDESTGNPCDLTATVLNNEGAIEACTDAMLADPAYGTIIVHHTFADDFSMRRLSVWPRLAAKHGKIIWEVEIMRADGKVTEVHIDAASGAVIDTEEKKSKEKKHEKKKEAKGRM